MPPLFFYNRLFALIFAWWVVLGALAWMRQNPQRRWYMFPVLTGAFHIGVFYACYLAAYLGWFRWTFNLQFFADWGSLLMTHLVTMTALIVLDLQTRFFSRNFGRWLGMVLVGGVASHG